MILNKRCVVFIGSGVSSGCYHSWLDLVNRLCEHCGSRLEVTRDSPADDFLDAAEDAKKTNEKHYYSYLGQHFGRSADHTNRLYDALLSLPFQCYLTTNFDPLLALGSRTAKIPCAPQINAYPSLDRKAMTNRTIHYLHGYIGEGTTPAPGTIVLSRSEFDDAYADNSNLMNFLVPTLENDPIAFIGCRLKEPDMERVFAICKGHQDRRMKVMKEREQGNSRPPQRFILLAEPEVRKALGEADAQQTRRTTIEEENAYYKGFDITPVWYPAHGSNHSALRYALEDLADLAPIAPIYGWEGGLYAT